MTVALLANAHRKAAYLRTRADADLRRGEGALSPSAGRRADAAERYLDGMRDLLAVLFDGGRAAVDTYDAEARAAAFGQPTVTPTGSDEPRR